MSLFYFNKELPKPPLCDWSIKAMNLYYGCFKLAKYTVKSINNEVVGFACETCMENYKKNNLPERKY